uniref:Non-structural maintenance of chromosomes element 4 n=1 Tax=Nothobranchius kadleci TaxID=1051664 RepID=A0A1A8BBQ1_NOTKA
MRRSKAGGNVETRRQNGSSNQLADHREGEDANGDSSSAAQQDDEDEINKQGQRREIRSKYRDLINSVQQNREDMLSPSNNKLTEVLEEANKLFKDATQNDEVDLCDSSTAEGSSARCQAPCRSHRPGKRESQPAVF